MQNKQREIIIFMKTIGIVAEFNPFHKGHKYAIDTLKKSVGADYVVIVMSGDYVQRGTCAIVDKFTRANMALIGGADLVIELPLYYSTSSAEFFARGAVSILDSLGCIDYIGFGSEDGNLSHLSKIAEFLSDEDEKFSESIKSHIKQGKSFAAARAGAVADSFGEDENIIASVLSSPNNNLAIEYLKALKWKNSSMIPVNAKRIGQDYNAEKIESGNSFSSATAIRNKISEFGNIISKKYADEILSSLMPSDTIQLLYDKKISDIDDFSELLHFKLLTERHYGFDSYVDVSSDLSDKIVNLIPKYESIKNFTMELKSKDITYTRISRALLHILLGMKKENLAKYVHKDHYVSYARILGLNKNASPLLKKVQECSTIPVLSKLSDAYKKLDENQLCLLNETINASSVFDLTEGNKKINEYAKSVITICR